MSDDNTAQPPDGANDDAQDQFPDGDIGKAADDTPELQKKLNEVQGEPPESWSAWLVEMKHDDGRPRWWNDWKRVWVDDANDATHYGRAHDANACIAARSLGTAAKALEHGFG